MINQLRAARKMGTVVVQINILLMVGVVWLRCTDLRVQTVEKPIQALEKHQMQNRGELNPDVTSRGVLDCTEYFALFPCDSVKIFHNKVFYRKKKSL